MVSMVSRAHLSSPPFKCKWVTKVVVGRERPLFAARTRSGFVTYCLSWHNAVALRLASSTKPEKSTSLVGAAAGTIASTDDADSTLEIKRSLYKAVEGIDRGIFGAPSEKKSEIEALVEQLESQNPTPNPTDHLAKVDGCWKLIYSTISILGSKRTKLGLRGFISLDDFLQKIDVAQGKAINEIKFNVRGLTMLSGQLIVTASFKISSKSRVDINFESSSISPDELLNLFQKNYDLLLGIFNPDGWLEITYVDESFRIGRDDKGNIFIVEKVSTS